MITVHCVCVVDPGHPVVTTDALFFHFQLKSVPATPPVKQDKRDWLETYKMCMQKGFSLLPALFWRSADMWSKIRAIWNFSPTPSFVRDIWPPRTGCGDGKSTSLRRGWLEHSSEQACGVGVPWSPGFGSESESAFWRRLRRWALSVLSGLTCNFVAVYLTSVRFILQLKLCLYTIVHLLLKNLNFSSVLLKYTIIISHKKSWSESESTFFYHWSRESGVLNFLTLESEDSASLPARHMTVRSASLQCAR